MRQVSHCRRVLRNLFSKDAKVTCFKVLWRNEQKLFGWASLQFLNDLEISYISFSHFIILTHIMKLQGLEDLH